MERLTALGISIGVLAGLSTWFAGTVTQLGSWQSPFVVWVAFASWACFYAAGGRSQWSVCCSPTPPRSSVTSSSGAWAHACVRRSRSFRSAPDTRPLSVCGPAPGRATQAREERRPGL